MQREAISLNLTPNEIRFILFVMTHSDDYGEIKATSLRAYLSKTCCMSSVGRAFEYFTLRFCNHSQHNNHSRYSLKDHLHCLEADIT